MVLKTLHLQCFKSFADKTIIDFHAVVTGIVGPNGCGKSNIVDAIKWVLGRVPPELCSDILQNGIYLTGGSAALPNLDTMIATEFGVPVSVARDAGECTTLGAGYMADHFDMLGGVSGKND